MGLTPATFNLTGDHKILRGKDWSKRLELSKADGSPFDLTPYIAVGALRAEFRASVNSIPIFFTTANGTLLLSIADAPNGLLDIRVPRAASIAIGTAGSSLPATCRYEIEGLNGSTGLVEPILVGTFEMSDEICLIP